MVTVFCCLALGRALPVGLAVGVLGGGEREKEVGREGILSSALRLVVVVVGFAIFVGGC